MKYFCLSLLLTICVIPVLSQSKVGYTYDAAGNRIKREMIVEKANQSISDFFMNGHESLQANNKYHVKFSLNPSDDLLQVTVEGYDPSDGGSVTLYSTQGTLLYKNKIVSNTFTLRMNSYPDGVYIIRITINEISDTWKITKQ